jgi:hypothetical protein
MRRSAGAVLVCGLLLLAGGCSSASHVCSCPQPVAYSSAQLQAIEKAREALPRGSILQNVLVDYENERDDLRFACEHAR